MLPSAVMNQKALDRRVKKHILAQPHRLFLPVIPGLEEAAQKELRRFSLKAEKEEEPGSLSAEGSLEDLWRAAAYSRCASRLYLRLLSFKAEGFAEFRKKSAAFPWELYLKEGASYRLRFSLRRCRLHVTDNIGKTLARAIRERFEEQQGTPPQRQERKGAHVPPEVQTILIRGEENRFTLSLDAGGGPLYDRGERPHVTDAPLRETLAASLLIEAGLNRESFLIDPMCGSGTFHLEALGLSAGLACSPGKVYPFEHWPSFRPARYRWVLARQAEQDSSSCLIASADRDEKALKAARANRALLDARGLSLPPALFRQEDFFARPCPPVPDGRSPLLILNPPYGMRLPLADRQAFFRRLGEKIRRDYRGIPWGIVVPGLEAEKALGLRWEGKRLFKNGGLPVSFLTGRCP